MGSGELGGGMRAGKETKEAGHLARHHPNFCSPPSQQTSSGLSKNFLSPLPDVPARGSRAGQLCHPRGWPACGSGALGRAQGRVEPRVL